MENVTVFYAMLFLFFGLASVAFKPVPTNDKVIWTQVVHMDAQQAGSTSDAQGLAIFRLTKSGFLYYKIIVQKVEEADALTAGHIHFRSNGRVALDLSEGVMDLGQFQMIQLTSQQIQTLLNEALYVNIHSQIFPRGIVSGDIR